MLQLVPRSELWDNNVHTVEGICGYRFPQETEDYTIEDPSAMDVDIDPQLVGRSLPEAQHSTQRSNLRLFPPPIFSRQGIPQNYKYVHAPPLSPFTAGRSKTVFVLLTFHGSWFAISVSRRIRCPPSLLSSTRKRARRRRDLSTRGAGRASGQRLSRSLRKGWVDPVVICPSGVPSPNSLRCA